MRRCRNATAVALLAVAARAGALAGDAASPSDVEEVARDLANPLSPVTTLLGQFRVEGGNGPDNEVNVQARLQPSLFVPFPDRSALLLRTIVPLPFRNWPTDDAGLGDVALVPYYVADITRRTFVGYGAALGIPTATADALGSGRWTAGPAMIVARTGMPVTYGGLVQHVWSYAGDDDRGEVCVTTLQPFFSYLLGGGWAASLTAEAVYNWNADAARWTVPLACGVTKVVNVGGRFVNLGMAGVGCVAKPDSAADWEIRLSATYVFK